MTKTPIQELLDGHAAFEKTVYQTDQKLFQDLAEHGQSPKTLVISCSDSRVDPMQIFQTKPGDLFVVRNVGALVPAHTAGAAAHSTGAAIEYAVKVLGVEAIIILGHSHCGAVDYCHKRINAPEEVSGLDFDFVPPWVDLAEQAGKPAEPDVPAFGARMLTQSLTNLEDIPFVADRVKKGTLSLSAMRFNIDTGKLEHIAQRG